MVLSRKSPVHLYIQIANVLRARIADGEYPVGERIPSETQLAKAFRVAPATVRQALDELKAEGLLEGRQGAGTYVSVTRHVDEQIQLSVPLEAVSEPMAEYEVTLLSHEFVAAPSDVAARLGIDAQTPCLRVRRLRRSDKGPVNYATSFYPPALGNLLDKDDLRSPLLMDALERHGVRFAEATQTIEASLASFDAAEVLEVPVGSPVLLVRRAYLLEGGRPGYVVLNRHPSPLFRYHARLTRAKSRERGDAWARWVLEASTEPSH